MNLPHIYIGYDPREEIAYHVLCRSIMRRASEPVAIIGVCLSSANLSRKADPMQSTEFAFSRFLVPYLAGFSGPALFMDCDMLCLGDISELFALFDPEKTVQVVKHEWVPKETEKFEGHAQVAYPRKCWSSLMLFNAARCGMLTPEVVDTASGRYLHEFEWCQPGSIGSLPAAWNHLVGVDAWNPDAKLVHFTSGGPWFPGYEDVDYADAWRKECYEAVHARQRSDYLER